MAKCTSPEEVLELAKNEGYELSDDDISRLSADLAGSTVVVPSAAAIGVCIVRWVRSASIAAMKRTFKSREILPLGSRTR